MKLIALSLTFLVPTVCHAGFVGGYQLKSLMEADEVPMQSRTPSELYDAPVYLGYLTGVIDALAEKTVCPPPSFTIRQAAEVIAQYLKAHPALWHLPGSVLIEQALSPYFLAHLSDSANHPEPVFIGGINRGTAPT